MFESLTDKLSGVFARITSRGVLNDKDIDEAMREIRVALLEADVALPVVKDFVARVKEEARGEKLVRSIQPGQLVVKIVHDELVKLLGAEDGGLNLNVVPPAVILMAGLQGSGKTTSSAKLAKMLGKNRKVLLASLDVYRPAAQEQLEQLARVMPQLKDVILLLKGSSANIDAIETYLNTVHDGRWMSRKKAVLTC